MEELINNIKENAKIIINGKEYIVKTKTLYGIEEDEEAYYYKCIMNTGDTLVIIPDDNLLYIGKEIEDMKYERPAIDRLIYDEKIYHKTGEGNQYIKNIKFGTDVEGKCVFEDFESDKKIISLGILPEKNNIRADILADIIDIEDIKFIKEQQMFKNKKVIIFDMDGTLIDSMGIWNKTDEDLIKRFTNKTVDEFFKENNIQSKDIGQLRDRLLAEFKSGDIYLQYCSWLKERFNTNKTAEEILKTRWEISNKLLMSEVDYKKDADILLKKLKEAGFILALATTTPKSRLDLYRKILKKVNIDEIFSVILSKEDVVHKKPDPEIYNKILEKLNVKPEKCIVVEDALIGVQSAKNAGIEVINMYDKYADADREEIDKLTDYKVKNFKELINILDRD